MANSQPCVSAVALLPAWPADLSVLTVVGSQRPQLEVIRADKPEQSLRAAAADSPEFQRLARFNTRTGQSTLPDCHRRGVQRASAKYADHDDDVRLV